MRRPLAAQAIDFGLDEQSNLGESVEIAEIENARVEATCRTLPTISGALEKLETGPLS